MQYSSLKTVAKIKIIGPLQTRAHCCRHKCFQPRSQGIPSWLPLGGRNEVEIFPRLPARATFVADTNFVSGTQKLFLILFSNILCPKQKFPSLRSMETRHSLPRVCARPRNIMSNNVSARCVLVCQGLSHFQINNQDKPLKICITTISNFH